MQQRIRPEVVAPVLKKPAAAPKAAAPKEEAAATPKNAVAKAVATSLAKLRCVWLVARDRKKTGRSLIPFSRVICVGVNDRFVVRRGPHGGATCQIQCRSRRGRGSSPWFNTYVDSLVIKNFLIEQIYTRLKINKTMAMQFVNKLDGNQVLI